MKLRDHPLMFYKGFRSWPPMWVCVDNSSKRPVEGDEIGTLMQATIHGLGESRITLRMNNEHGEYLAIVDFDDHTFCMQAYERLKNYVGKSIRDAGDMEFEK
jgi:hypothetical protein